MNSWNQPALFCLFNICLAPKTKKETNTQLKIRNKRSPSPVIKDMQIKPKCHYSLLKLLKLLEGNSCCWWGHGEWAVRALLFVYECVQGSVGKCYFLSWKWLSYKIFKNLKPYRLIISLLGIHPNETIQDTHKVLYKNTYPSFNYDNKKKAKLNVHLRDG